MTFQIEKLQEEERQAIGHEFGNTIKACTFKQRDCLKSRYAFWTLTQSFLYLDYNYIAATST